MGLLDQLRDILSKKNNTEQSQIEQANLKQHNDESEQQNTIITEQPQSATQSEEKQSFCIKKSNCCQCTREDRNKILKVAGITAGTIAIAAYCGASYFSYKYLIASKTCCATTADTICCGTMGDFLASFHLSSIGVCGVCGFASAVGDR